MRFGKIILRIDFELRLHVISGGDTGLARSPIHKRGGLAFVMLHDQPLTPSHGKSRIYR